MDDIEVVLITRWERKDKAFLGFDLNAFSKES